MAPIVDISAAFIVVTCIIGILWWLLKRKKKAKPAPQPQPQDPPPTPSK